MSKLNGVKSATAILMTLSMSGGAITPLVAPIVAPAAAVAQTSNFPDVEQSYWAADFISALTQRDIINGFPDGTFKPDAPVTRHSLRRCSRWPSRSRNNFLLLSLRISLRVTGLPQPFGKPTKLDFYQVILAEFFNPAKISPRASVSFSGKWAGLSG